MDYYKFSAVAQRLQDKGWLITSQQHGTRVLCRLIKDNYTYEISLPWNMLYNRVSDCGKIYGSVSHFCGYDNRPVFEFNLNQCDSTKWVTFNQWCKSMFELEIADLTPFNNE